MNILILGGSNFIGPIIIDKLLACGHNLTVFNRGKSKSSYPKTVRFIKGDRDSGFNINNHFDAVIDMCAYYGDQTKAAISQINFDFFVHCSSAAVYKKSSSFPLTEDSPIGVWPLWGDYNRVKVECENILAESDVKYASLRPVYILGPNNSFDREHFIYSRLKKGQQLVLPGDGSAKVQFVHVNDVVNCFVLLAEKQLSGVFNCAGDDITSLNGLVIEMGKIAGKKPVMKTDPKNDGENFDWVSFPFPNEPFLFSNKKIKSHGIAFTPLFNGLKKDYKNYYSKII